MGLLETLGKKSPGGEGWYLPAPAELPLGANHPGAFRLPPGSMYSPALRRMENPRRQKVDAPTPAEYDAGVWSQAPGIDNSNPNIVRGMYPGLTQKTQGAGAVLAV